MYSLPHAQFLGPRVDGPNARPYLASQRRQPHRRLSASPADELQTRLHRPALPDYDARTKLATLRFVPKTSTTSSLSAINTQLSCEYIGE